MPARRLPNEEARLLHGAAAMRLTFLLCLTATAACGGISLSSIEAEGDAARIENEQERADAGRDARPPGLGRDAKVVNDADDEGEDANGGRCCGDNQNGSFAPETNCVGTSLAWEYTPKCDLALTTLELHATGGLARIYDSDAAGRPGVLLLERPLPTSSTPKFLAANVSPPLLLRAGHKYFLGKDAGMCSIATGGTQQEYYAMDGSRAGPFKGHAFTSRLRGNCK